MYTSDGKQSGDFGGVWLIMTPVIFYRICPYNIQSTQWSLKKKKKKKNPKDVNSKDLSLGT